MLYKKDIPTLYLKMTDLVEKVKNKLSKSYRVAAEINAYGNDLYIKDKDGKPILWFGIWYQDRKESGSPFCLAVWEKWSASVVKKFRSKFGKETIPFDKENWYIHGLSEDYLSNVDAVKTLAEQISRTVEYIKK